MPTSKIKASYLTNAPSKLLKCIRNPSLIKASCPKEPSPHENYSKIQGIALLGKGAKSFNSFSFLLPATAYRFTKIKKVDRFLKSKL